MEDFLFKYILTLLWEAKHLSCCREAYKLTLCIARKKPWLILSVFFSGS